MKNIFKYIVLIVFILVINTITGLSLDSLSFKLTVFDDSEVTNQLFFGINKFATDTLDLELGESDLPPFPPPGNTLFTVFYIVDSLTQYRYWSYYDIRGIPQENQFIKYYTFEIMNPSFNGFTVSWSPIKNYVDSAFIRDIFTGKITNVDMKKQQSFFQENSFTDRYNIIIYYNKNLTDISDESFETKFNTPIISPNPVKDKIIINNLSGYENYTIYNEVGIKIKSGNPGEENFSINIENESNGLYFLVLEDMKNDKRDFIKFIKY